MNSQGGVSLILLLWTVTLSVTQAMALRLGGPRALYHVLAWTVASVVAVALAFWLFGLHRSPAEVGAETTFLVLLAGAVNVLALWAGARWGSARGPVADPLGRQVLRLLGIHFAVVFGGGLIGASLFVVFRLSRVRW